MKINRRKLFALCLLLSIFATQLTGCGEWADFGGYLDGQDWEVEDDENDHHWYDPDDPDENNDRQPSLTTNETPNQTTATGKVPENPWGTEAPKTEEKPPIEESEKYEVLTDAEELRDFLYESIEKGEFEPKFCYTGDKDDLKARNVARILSAYFVTVRKLSDGANHWQVEYTPYPGERIVDAYRSGNTAKLSSEEKKALNKAVEVVEAAKAASSNSIQLELYLHDWLCDRVTYYNGSTDVKDENDILRHLTALGAILDGKANCQGYTDGFYVLASIAGFDVGKQSCIAEDGGHSFNTICLDGKWYVVDVTYNDDTYHDQNEFYRDYRLFNAGTRECGEYTWPDEYEYHPLQKTGGNVYFYNLSAPVSPLYGYEKCYDDIEDVTDAIVREWKNNGRIEIYMMLQGEQASWQDLELQQALNQTGLAFRYRVWSLVAGNNTYFFVLFC